MDTDGDIEKYEGFTKQLHDQGEHLKVTYSAENCSVKGRTLTAQMSTSRSLSKY